MERIVAHPSHLTSFELCAYRFYRTSILGERRPPGFVVPIGSSVNDAVDRDLQNKIDHGELLSVDEVQTISRDALVRRWDDEGVLLVGEEKEKGEAAMKAHAIEVTVRLATLHHNELAPLLQPQAVQVEWRMNLPSYSFDLSGCKDLVEIDESIDDLKTTDKALSAVADGAHAQMTTYAMETWARTKALPPKVRLHVVRRKIPKKSPPIEIIETVPDFKRFEPLLRRYESMAEHITAGRFHPNGRGTWTCQEKYCGFYPCKYV